MLTNRLLAISLAVILLLLPGCDQGKPKVAAPKNADIETAVVRYNTLLADCYRNLDMNPLAHAATKKRTTKAFFHMAALEEAGVKMDAKLRRFSFGDVKVIAPDQVEIPAQESWDYSYWDIDTGKDLFDNSVHFRLVYTLAKQMGTWLVADISVKEAREKKDSTFIFKRPANVPLPKVPDPK